MNRRIAFLLAVLAQLGFLGWMVADQERLLARGREVILPIQPFDPIDPLSGRYLAIQLQASRVDLAALDGSVDAEGAERRAEQLVGQRVYVRLREKDGRWEPDSIGPLGWGEPAANEVWLRGAVRARYGTTVDVDFGLDRYFIPANASDPSPLLWQQGHQLAIVARVSPDGRGSIADLIVDGKPFAAWNAAQPK
jgi:uncharacterized membrane-anchored protein